MELQTFNFNVMPVRVVTVDAEPWFVAVDVAAILGLGNPRSSLALLDEDEKGVHNLDTPGGRQNLNIISESGLYSLILRSRKPEARPFRKWLTGEVIPTLRRTGRYTLAPQPILPQSMPEALRRLADSLEAEAKARAALELAAPKVEAFEALMHADGTYAVGAAAKLLGTGELRLFALLRERQVLMDKARSGTEHHNLPYQRYLDAGYFVVITRPRPGGESGRVS